MTTVQSDNTKSRKYYQLGIGYLDLGMYQNALDCFEYVQKTEKKKRKKTASLAKCYSLLGRTLAGLNRFRASAYYQRKAYRLFRSIHRKTPCTEALASCRSSLAFCFEKQNKENKGLRFRKKALKLLQKEEVKNTGKIALCHEAIGMNYYRRGNDKKTLEHLSICLQMWEEGNEKPELLERINRILGEISYSMNKKKEAFAFLTEACRLQEIIFKEFPFHPCFEESYFTLGSICDEMGEYEKGLTYFLKAFRVAEVNYKNKEGAPYLCLLFQSLYYDYLAVGDSIKSVYFYNMWEKNQRILVERLQKNMEQQQNSIQS